jgi:hypothetical protein
VRVGFHAVAVVMSSNKQNNALRNESEEHFLSFVAQTHSQKHDLFKSLAVEQPSSISTFTIVFHHTLPSNSKY